MTVSNWKSLNKNSLVGVFDLALDSGMCIYGAMLFQKGENTWCSFPGIPFEKQDGTKGYKPVVEIPDRARRDTFNAAVIAELKKQGHI